MRPEMRGPAAGTAGPSEIISTAKQRPGEASASRRPLPRPFALSQRAHRFIASREWVIEAALTVDPPDRARFLIWVAAVCLRALARLAGPAAASTVAYSLADELATTGARHD